MVTQVTDKYDMGGSLLTIEEWEQVAREADFSPSKMAGLLAISERQLQRLFRKYMRCTPSHWLRELQCRLARQLVARGYSNKDVAAQLKFASDAHLCREFKKVFGTTPQSFAPNRAVAQRQDSASRLSIRSWSALQRPVVQEKSK